MKKRIQEWSVLIILVILAAIMVARAAVKSGPAFHWDQPTLDAQEWEYKIKLENRISSLEEQVRNTNRQVEDFGGMLRAIAGGIVVSVIGYLVRSSRVENSVKRSHNEFAEMLKTYIREERDYEQGRRDYENEKRDRGR